MPIKKFKPITPTQRYRTIVDSGEITRDTPEPSPAGQQFPEMLGLHCEQRARQLIGRHETVLDQIVTQPRKGLHRNVLDFVLQQRRPDWRDGHGSPAGGEPPR